MLVGIYFIVNDGPLAIAGSVEKYRVLIPLLVHLQLFAFMVSIIIFVSSVNDKVRKKRKIIILLPTQVWIRDNQTHPYIFLYIYSYFEF